MAGPTPPIPPLSTPFAQNLRDQRRAAHRQAHSERKQRHLLRVQQKAARKQARSLLSQQRRTLRRTSLLAPLLLLVCGSVALLVRAGHPALAIFLPWYSRWWPLLFLFAGLFLLIEWAADLFLLTGDTPAAPRRLGAAATLLLLFLGLLGTGTHTLFQARNLFRNNLQFGLGDFEKLLDQKHEFSQTIDTAFPAGTRLRVDNPHGSVTLIGARTDGQIHITVDKQIFTSSDDDASRQEQQLNPQLSLADGTLQLSIPRLVGSSADLTVTLPASAPISISAQHGSVDLSDLQAPVTVTADHGDITCKNINGAVSAQINHNGSSFIAHNVTGDLQLHGHAQDLTLTEIHGQVDLEGEFFGNTHLEHLYGPLAFRTHRTQLTLGRLPGEIDINPESDLSGSQIVGPTLLHTSSRNVSLDRVLGDLSVTDSRGSVDITASSPLGSIDVQNRDGAVALTVPEHAALTLDAFTHGGTIETDLGLTPTGENGNQTLQGVVHGGGPHITIRTSHLDIDIHQGQVDPSTNP